MSAQRDTAARSNDTSPERELVITRVLDAPRALVFKAWTEPDRLVRWFGPQGFTTASCKMDVRPGGAWRVCMRSPDGADHWVQGVYRDVVAPERLVFTWAWEDAEGKPLHETLVTVTLAEQGTKTMLTMHHARFESVTARDQHRGGWTETVDRLGDYVATA